MVFCALLETKGMVIKMIIVIICDVLGEENNGTTVAAMNLIRSLQAKGHTVRVVCPDETRRGDPNYFIIPTINFGPLNNYVRKNGVSIARPDAEILESAIDGADAVHLLVPFFASNAVVKLAQARDIPVTAGFHCQAENFTNHILLMNSKRFNRKVYRFFDRHVYSMVDCIHYPTQFIRNTYEQAIGHKTQGRVISNGVNRIFVQNRSEKPAEYKDTFVILFTGRYSKEKSHCVLIDGAARSKYADRIQLVFAGAGPQEAHIRKYAAKRLKRQPIMSFFTRQELVKVINYADLYVHPAEIEIEAISCLEAISCGLVPVIADSPRSATRFFALSEQNLFRFNNPKSLAERIDYWLDSPERLVQCRQQYLGYAKRFDQQTCMDEMERMISDTIRRKHGEAD